MTPIRIYLYSNCSTCRVADAILAASGREIVRRDIFKAKLSAAEITSLLGEIGKTPFEVLSTRSIPYRELGLANRDVGADELIALMSEYPGLLRRPIIIAGDTKQVGFKWSAVEALVAS